MLSAENIHPSEKVWGTPAWRMWDDPTRNFGETIALTGPKRTGKTLSAVRIIVQRLQRGSAEFVVSNVNLDLSSIGLEHKFRYFKDIEEIKELGDSNRKYIFYLDELRRFADSRMSQTSKNRLISNLLADLGKQQVDFIFSDQDVNAVDKRIKINIDWVICPKMYEQRLLEVKRDHEEKRWADLGCHWSILSNINQ